MKLTACIVLVAAAAGAVVLSNKGDSAETVKTPPANEEEKNIPAAPAGGPEKLQGDSKALLGSPEFYPSPERPVGWRGDGTGRFPGATPPLNWGRKIAGPYGTLRSSIAPPKDGSPDPQGEELSFGAIKSWLVLGPFPVASPLEGIEKELLQNEAALKPAVGEKGGDKVWRKIGRSGANQSGFGMMTHVGQNNPPKGYNFFGDEAPREKSTNVAGLLASYLYSPEAQKVIIHLGDHSEGLKVYVNGGVIYSESKAMGPNHRPTKTVTLQKGWNTVLVKTTHAERGWDFSLNVQPSETGKDLKYESENIRWLLPTPGPSCSQPVVVGEKIYYLAGIKHFSPKYTPTNLLVCSDKNTGKILWIKSTTWYDTLKGEGKKRYPAADPALFDTLDALTTKIDAANAGIAEQINALSSPNGLPDENDPRMKAWNASCAERDKLFFQIFKEMGQLDKDKFTLPSNDWGWTNPVPCSDGKAIYIFFTSGETTAFDLSGKRLWIRFDTPGASHHGHHSSPLVVDGKFIYCLASAKGREKSQLVALDCAKGSELWATFLNSAWNHGGCVIGTKVGGEPIVATGDGTLVRVSNGEKVGSVPAINGNCSSAVFAAGKVFVDSTEKWAGGSGGRLMAQLPDQFTGKITPKVESLEGEGIGYIPSPLFHEGKIYDINSTKNNLWVNDVANGKLLATVPLDLHMRTSYINDPGICASPTLAGKYIFVMDNNNVTAVIDPSQNYKTVAVNTLGGMGSGVYCQSLSNPVFEGNRMYYRGLTYIYCAEEK